MSTPKDPEERARQTIDSLLEQAGWQVQQYKEIHLPAKGGVAVGYYPLSGGQEADYLLFVDRKAVGVIEAKAEGKTLRGYELQAERYSEAMTDALKKRAPFPMLPFHYLSTGTETLFVNHLDPKPVSRELFAFHRPEEVAIWVADGENTLRRRLQTMPPIHEGNLWGAQIEAIQGLETHLAANRPRVLIHMATGSGKTFTAVNYLYRLIKYANAKRVLFLVDRNNLGRQTLSEFQAFITPDEGQAFDKIYPVAHLSTNTIPQDTRVVITTIQRLFSMLKGEKVFDSALEDASQFALDGSRLALEPPKDVAYNPAYPIEYFDFIVVDECHRSIYNLWRQVLEYFDAFLIGMTATPSKMTVGFFNETFAIQYDRRRAELDGVNVGGQVYKIRTKLTAEGSTIEAGPVQVRSRFTRKKRQEVLDEEFVYTASQLDREVVAPSQIRLVLTTFKEMLFTTLFPGRTHVPKTLIFAKDDNHAETITEIVREVFGEDNQFCQKITYRTDGDPDTLIRKFTNRYFPRIAVTVDMIATGTDIKPLEILLFMRLVKSPLLFEQMQGRGVRVIKPTDLRNVTQDADEGKTHFVIVDCVGVTELERVEVTPALDRNPAKPLRTLLQEVASGDTSNETLGALAKRIATLGRKATPDDNAALKSLIGVDLQGLATQLFNATDIDVIAAATGNPDPTDADLQAIEDELKDAILDQLTPKVRDLLEQIRSRSDILIDEASRDELLSSGYSAEATEQAATTLEQFRTFVGAQRDELEALKILFAIPYRRRGEAYRQIGEARAAFGSEGKRLQREQLKAVVEALRRPPLNLTADKIWQAYSRVAPDKVAGNRAARELADLVALVRYVAEGETGDLQPYEQQVAQRYTAWRDAQSTTTRTFTPDQQAWLDRIAHHIGINVTIEPGDLETGDFYDHGGRTAIAKSFGSPKAVLDLLEELNSALVA